MRMEISFSSYCMRRVSHPEIDPVLATHCHTTERVCNMCNGRYFSSQEKIVYFLTSSFILNFSECMKCMSYSELSMLLYHYYWVRVTPIPDESLLLLWHNNSWRAGPKKPLGLRPSGRVNPWLQPRVWSNPDQKRGLYSLSKFPCYDFVMGTSYNLGGSESF